MGAMRHKGLLWGGGRKGSTRKITGYVPALVAGSAWRQRGRQESACESPYALLGPLVNCRDTKSRKLPRG